MKTRAIEKEVFVEATSDVVWRAISDAEQLARWFPVEARVEPGVGGSIWLSWGSGAEGAARIAHWEPNRRLGWTEPRGTATLAVDFFLEPKGSGTIVRLVQSGFGTGAEWDDEYHMTQGGWAYFLEHLRWYLEEHRDLARQLLVFREPVGLSRPEALGRLIGPRGLSTTDALASLTAGDRYKTTTTTDERLTGTVVSVSRETGQMGLTVDQLNRGILFLEMEPHKTGAMAGFWLSVYGLPPDALAEARGRFGALYAAALGL
jgi:uncharacterized protein YndB with AHSA1/START domain